MLLKIVCFFLVVDIVVTLFISKTTRAFAFADWIFAHPVVAALREGLTVFMVQNSVGFDAMRRTALFMVVYALFLAMLGWESFSGGHNSAVDTDFSS